MVGVVASTSGTMIGALMGLASGYFGGKTDAIIQRIVDILMAFPVLILAMALLAALDRSLNTLLVAVAVPFIPYGARVVRATCLVIKESQYVESARAIGASDWRVILMHIAPWMPGSVHGGAHRACGCGHHHGKRAWIPGARHTATHAHLGRDAVQGG